MPGRTKRPHRQASIPEAQDVVIELPDYTEVVPPRELVRRKLAAEQAERARRRGYDLVSEHALLALPLGGVVRVPDYTGDIWWFVTDVLGPERTIAACTVLFEQLRVETFPFDITYPGTLTPDEKRQAQL